MTCRSSRPSKRELQNTVRTCRILAEWHGDRGTCGAITHVRLTNNFRAVLASRRRLLWYGVEENPPVATRRFPRYKTDRPLFAVLFWDDMPVQTVHGRCRVLGLGGLSATLSHQFYIGEIVRLQLPPTFQAYASVRSARGTDYGFEFILVNDTERRAIKRLCEVCSAASGPKPPGIGSSEPN